MYTHPILDQSQVSRNTIAPLNAFQATRVIIDRSACIEHAY